MTHNFKRYHPLAHTLIKDPVVLVIISLYALAMFLDGFPAIHRWSMANNHLLHWVEFTFILYFILEAILKIAMLGWRSYLASSWNRFDLTIVLISLPSLVQPIDEVSAYSAVLMLRIGRLARLFKLLKFIPNGPHIWTGIVRALKASIGVFLALLLLNLLFAMGATTLFGEIAPEYFGDPVRSIYTMFKVFTVEGWFEIPDTLAGRTGSALTAFLVRTYFVIAVLIGGILGLSLANAVFVDEMTSDNTARVENMVQMLEDEIHELRKEREAGQRELVSELQTELREVRRELAALREGK